MDLRCVTNDFWSVWVTVVRNADGTESDCLSDLSEADLDTALALFDHITESERGTRALGDNRNHSINDNPKILQLSVTGTLRAAYFLTADRRIVVTHFYQKPRRQLAAEVKKALIVLRNFEATAPNWLADDE